MKIKLAIYAPRDNKITVNALAGALSVHAWAKKMKPLFPETPRAMSALLSGGTGTKYIAGFPMLSAQRRDTLQLVSGLKHRLKERIFIIAGGPHPTAEPLQVLDAGADAVVCGEGEETFPELVRAVMEETDVGKVRGIAIKNGAGMVFTGRRPEADLDRFPPIAPIFGRYGPLEITRGCPFACKFCQTAYLFGTKVRHRSVKEIIRWSGLMVKLGMKDFRAITPNAFAYGSPDGKQINYAALEDLLSSLRKLLGPDGKLFFGSFPSEVRPEHVNEKTLALVLKYCDNTNLVIGGQSGSQRVINACGRGHTVRDIFNAAELTIKHGLRANVDMIFRLPGETPHDAELTVEAVRKLLKMGARVHGHTFMPLAGTPYASASKPPYNADYIKALKKIAVKGQIFGDWVNQENYRP